MPAKIVPEAELSKGDLWVFGYGSLMWRPGFEFIEQVPARLIGEHRALCVYSFDHRGTPEKPGLVLGLDRGGACRGVAFRVAAKQRDATVDYLRAREQTTMVYREVMRSVWLENEAAAAGQRAGLRGRSRPCAICRTAVAGRATALRAAGPRPFRQQPRLRAGHGEVDRGAGFSRRAIASAGGDAARRRAFASPAAVGGRVRRRDRRPLQQAFSKWGLPAELASTAPRRSIHSTTRITSGKKANSFSAFATPKLLRPFWSRIVPLNRRAKSASCSFDGVVGTAAPFARRSIPARRSPINCFSASDRASVPDRLSLVIIVGSPLVECHTHPKILAPNHMARQLQTILRHNQSECFRYSSVHSVEL